MADFNRQLNSRYGLTKEQYEAMYKAQGEKCLGCNAKVKLVVDHNHSNGDVRGLLCKRCNTAIGMAQDSVEILGNLQKYLLSSPAHIGSQLKKQKRYKGANLSSRPNCLHGHAFTPANTYRYKKTNGRYCRKCRALAEVRRKAKLLEAIENGT